MSNAQVSVNYSEWTALRQYRRGALVRHEGGFWIAVARSRGVEPGTDDEVWSAVGSDDGGGGATGSPVVRAFPFDFDTPDLLTGAAVYTPAVGDVLLDAWLEVVTVWDGTTPRFDFGMFPEGREIDEGFLSGAFLSFGGLSLTASESVFPLAGGYRAGNSLSVYSGIQSSIYNASGSLKVASPGGTGAGLDPRDGWVPATLGRGIRYFPGKFGSTEPVRIVVSQDGTPSGADPGSTQGSAIFYLVTCTPLTGE